MNDTPETKVHDEVQSTSNEPLPEIPNFLKTKPSTADEGVAKGVPESMPVAGKVEFPQHTARVSQQEGRLHRQGAKPEAVYTDIVDISNDLSSLSVQSDIDQFDDRIEGLIADISVCDTDMDACEKQIEAWRLRYQNTARRRHQLESRRRALRTAKRALLDAVEDN